MSLVGIEQYHADSCISAGIWLNHMRIKNR